MSKGGRNVPYYAQLHSRGAEKKGARFRRKVRAKAFRQARKIQQKGKKK